MLLNAGLPQRLRNPDAIKRYLGRRYPACHIDSIRLNIQITSISSLEDELSVLEDILSDAEKTGDKRLFSKFPISACLNTDSPPLAIEFYGEKKKDAENSIKREAHEMFFQDNKLDSAFVRLEQMEDARQIGTINVWLAFRFINLLRRKF